MTKEEKRKLMKYTTLILEAVQEKLEEAEIPSEDIDWTLFIHAYANIAPAMTYNRLTGDNKNHLQFNHMANQLCFQFMEKEE